MKPVYTIFLPLLAGLVLSSCKDLEEGMADEAVIPETKIELLSPALMQNIREEDTVRIVADISSNVPLHEYLVQVRHVVNDEIIYSYEGHSHERSVAVRLYTFFDVSTDTEMELIVTTLDHNSNKTQSSRAFKVLNTMKAPRPGITLLSPLQVQVNDGDDVLISGWVRHVLPVTNVDITLLRNMEEVLRRQFEPLADSFYFELPYRVYSPENSDFELTVTASDSAGNTGTHTQRFHVHR